LQPVKTVPCPRCGAPSPFTPGNAWRPFCSERCKLSDLGAWAAEEYRVPETGDAASDPLSPAAAESGESGT
jgi:endogenous inhibitor of DNA gyrase (YacG/DUF329 family)